MQIPNGKAGKWIEQRILNSAPHSPGRTKGLVDVAGLGDTTGLGSRSQSHSFWNPSSSFLLLGMWTVSLLRDRGG